MTITYHDDLSTFCTINDMPNYSDWNEVADFLDVKYYNGGARDAVKVYLKPETTKPQPPAPAAPPAVSTDDLFKLFAARVNEHITAPNIDEAQVIDLINKYSKPYTAKTEIIINNETKGTLPGRQHDKFSDVMRKIAAGVDLYLYGSAGTGKTKIARHAAQALNAKFYAISVCSQTQMSAFLGYPSATGQYITTHFRQAYENGGVFLIDEIDNGNPNVLAVLNSAMDGICGFPDAMVERHPAFVCIATANTFGTGADRVYVGRNQIDGATMNRFLPVEIGYDELLESEIFGEVAMKVQRIRHQLKNDRVIISMRNILNVTKLMKVGYSEEEAIQEAVIETIPHNLRSKVK